MSRIAKPIPRSPYAALVAAGVELDSHESDLYALDTSRSRAILYAHGKAVIPFRATDGRVWLDIPFGFDPFWAKVAGESSDQPECTCEPGSPYLCPSCERKAEEQPHGF